MNDSANEIFLGYCMHNLLEKKGQNQKIKETYYNLNKTHEIKINKCGKERLISLHIRSIPKQTI